MLTFEYEHYISPNGEVKDENDHGKHYRTVRLLFYVISCVIDDYGKDGGPGEV